MESLPLNLINEEIFSRLDLQTLLTVSCVSKTLKSSIKSQLLPFKSSLELPSSLLPDADTLSRIITQCTNFNSLALNCQRLHESCLTRFLTRQLRQLSLSRCSLFTYQIFISIGQNCPFLRVLMLELTDQGLPDILSINIGYMLRRCIYLESLCIKIRGTKIDVNAFQSVELFLPKTVKILKLKSLMEGNAVSIVKMLAAVGTFSCAPVSPTSYSCALQSLSLVLNVISDQLLMTITSSLPLLVELDLEDRPSKEPSHHVDLTNNGLQSLGSCHHLTGLSLIRSRKKHPGSFKRINDMGMFLLSESCKDLQSLRLFGFSKVSDAGFASLLHSCQKLQKFEVRNALLLSDLAFHNLNGTASALVEVRLLSCSLITSETVKTLHNCRTLELLDLCGCKSIADSCMGSILHLQKLTYLNLSGADITDAGLSILSQGSFRIWYLSLRGCKRITDKGISSLLHADGTIVQTLAALDAGCMPGLSDNGIITIVTAGKEITELCIRNCFNMTDSSIHALATKRNYGNGNKPLQQLDIYNCSRRSVDLLSILRKPFFSGLHWLGIGLTWPASYCKERPWLTMCFDGCEMGCHDGWKFHSPSV
ncbi:F-box protein At-B [Mercurialis annua]|uniref:F-box protein At-B n=1 Tax=Mercurialis annua TaxID=3986 RepID=UPI002160F3B5|nr:F-box protein At-B [Mercurialis annua]